jgi:hypothetical protein
MDGNSFLSGRINLKHKIHKIFVFKNESIKTLDNIERNKSNTRNLLFGKICHSSEIYNKTKL